ncbi:MAG: ABC-three component system middle component 6 [Candidatus Electronema sp. V4]|uniref:ABC-three component system middle component 6 n=1 Tax=Candidatus Electronema sp. V4 TaxID=3454756 RepID=UPI0040558F0E
MFIPSKHENLNKSTIVIGADIISFLRRRDYNIEELFQELKNVLKKDVSLNQYYNIITFLWLIELVDFQKFTIKLKGR